MARSWLTRLPFLSRKSSRPSGRSRSRGGVVNGSRVSPQRVEPQSGPSGEKPELPRSYRPLFLRPLFWAVLLAGAGIAGGGTRAYRVIEATNANLPDPNQALTYQRDGTITMTSADGVILQKLGPATRETITYDAMPQHLVQAFIASEDQRFYEHNGVDYRGIARAVWANVQNRDLVEGASTITQQLARIVFLDQERSFQRKIKEAMMASKLEESLTKEQIIERYLNLVYLGSGAYGVADASWVYFGKTIDQLTVAEAAMIAGMAPAPSLYSPTVNVDAARSQRNRVIRRMLATEAISGVESEEAITAEVAVTPNQPKFLYSEFPYFTIYIQKQLEALLPPDQLEAGGLTVETTLNVVWQRRAEETVEEAVADYSGWQNVGQVSLVAVDPRNGEIKAMVGGTDFTSENQFNRVTQAQRQPGSTFKTFVYAAAIAGGISPYRSYMDARYVVDGYEPKNYGKNYSGNMDLLQALRNSVNIVAVKLLVDVGFDPVVKLAERMGIESPLLPAYSLALGTSEVNLLELTSAYGTLANKGIHRPAHGIRRVLNSSGEVIYERPNESEQAIDADSAAIMTWMLRGVVEGGTGSNAYIGRPVAGKTGTSEEYRDLWFVGYIPQLVAGVWMGNDDNTPTSGASSMAAGVWRNFMAKLTDDIPVEEFPSLPRLGGREGTITLSPVKPGRVVAENGPSRSSEAASSSGGGESRRSRRSESSSNSGGEAAAPPARASNNSSSSSPPASPEPAAPAPVVTEDPPAAVNPAPAPPAPAPVAPAPPAPAPAPAPPPLVAPPPPLEAPPPAGGE
ncbi:PBP1A family penicillin-binding protein [Nodosilinea sp. FACHB-131]|uniref:transglycosylase domain-containing protein n=1 Tax=Cyanophyceae TaxID=3028117 RepID=UPI00168958F6|nr:PBP1A family penicillin-binding protein [Nodosilinea sp. FACHB-131]MBD1876335.1 PBP1A family penicillin-binding protein [Nodosilinea sp. FACHB-131]